MLTHGPHSKRSTAVDMYLGVHTIFSNVGCNAGNLHNQRGEDLHGVVMSLHISVFDSNAIDMKNLRLPHYLDGRI